MTTEELKKAFADAEQEIQLYAQETPKYNSLVAYKNRITKLTVKTLNALNAKIKRYKQSAIPEIYADKITAVAEELVKQYEDAGVDVPDLKDAAGDLTITNAQVNCDVYLTRAVEEAEANMQQLIDESVESVTDAREAQQKLAVSVANGVECGQTFAHGTLMQLMLSSYGNTCLNGIENDILNSATLDYASANDYDLVQISQHFGTCPICLPYEGRVYSKSGSDPRFPYLYDTPWSDAFQNLHPNCRHQLLIYVEDLQTSAYRNEMLRFSNRSFTIGGSGWTQRDMDYANKSLGYYRARQQTLQRLSSDRDQYERYKARLGGDAPKTFAAFRRIKSAGGKAWEELQKKYRAAAKTPPTPTTPVVKKQTAKKKAETKPEEKKKRTALETDVKKKDGTLKPEESYAKLLNDKYASGTQIGKDIYAQNIPSDGGVVVQNDLVNEKGEPRAFEFEGEIRMNYADDEHNPKRLGENWFHEHGHYIDGKLDITGSYSNPTQWGKDFQATLKKEVKAYENAIKKDKEFKKVAQAREFIGSQFRKDDMNTKSVQDIFGGSANVGHYPTQDWRSCWGHEKSYWKDRPDNGVAKEAWAEMFEAQFDAGRAETFQKYLPESWNMFMQKMGEIKK